MKTHRYLSIILIASVQLCYLGACSDVASDDTEQLILQQIPHRTPKPPCEPQTDTLRILAIGNSFTFDATEYLPELIDSAGITPEVWGLYTLTASSASLQFWWDTLLSDSVVSCRTQHGGIRMQAQGTLTELLSQPWDIISFQQVSYLSWCYASFHPTIDSLTHRARSICPNPDVRIAWHQTWSYDDGFGNTPSCDQMYEDIAQASARLYADGDLDILIPAGTALQNARHTELNTPHNLTMDGMHLMRAVGSYVAACTWFETLFAPTFGISVVGNSATHAVSNREEAHQQYDTADVTPENRKLCQQCAYAAVRNPFETSVVGDNSTAL